MINDISKSDRQTILDILKGICTIFVIVIFIFGLYSQPFVDFFSKIAGL